MAQNREKSMEPPMPEKRFEPTEPPVTCAATSSEDGKKSSSSSASTHSLNSLKGYQIGNRIGNGSFGVVHEAKVLLTGEKVAIKKVLQDPRFKNRELEIIREVNHVNIVNMKAYFFTENEEAGQKRSFLHVVMEFIPDTVCKIMRSYVKYNCEMPKLIVKLYTYQLCRAVGYLHSLGICHRDIKPQNLLVDNKRQVLKLCDFGSAKRLRVDESNVAYICSRFYRAPELMMAAVNYTTSIDLWSIGCVLGELLLGKPLFTGTSSMDQLIMIIRVLGTPTMTQMYSMNPGYTEFRLPDIPPRKLEEVFSKNVSKAAIDLLKKFLQYEPEARIPALEALSHEFFDELRNPKACLINGDPLPELFSFSESELQQMTSHARQKVIPAWMKKKS